MTHARWSATPDATNPELAPPASPAPGKVATTTRIQRRAAPRTSAPAAPGDAPAGEWCTADDPFGLHLKEADGDEAAQRASDRVRVRVNGGPIETWMVVRVVDARCFIAADPRGAQYKFTGNAQASQGPERRGEVMIPRLHPVYEIERAPASPDQQRKTRAGRLFHLVQEGIRWIQVEASGKSRQALDEEEAARQAEQASKVGTGTRA